MASLSESELLSLLSSLSMSRTRSFLRMVEDECIRLVCMRASTRGRIRTLNTPPLSEKLRELVSVTSRRFKIRDSTMPEGDLEKPMSLRATAASRIPTLLYADLVPDTCPLESIARYGLPPPIIAGDADQERDQQQRNRQPEGGQGHQESAEGKAAAAGGGAGEGGGGRRGEGGEGGGRGGGGGEVMGATSRESEKESAGGRTRGRGRPMGVYRPGRMAEARQEAAAAAEAQATIGSKTESPTSSSRARPSMGVYRPGRMVQAREAASCEAMDMDDDRGSARGVGDEAQHGKARGTAERGAQQLDDGMTGGDEEEEGEEEMAVVHDYEGYRLDLTLRTWGEQERRQPYVELEGSTWRCDDAWMLRGEGGNGSVMFCVQPEAGSSAPCSVTVGLAPERMGKMGEGCTFRVAVSKDAAVITRHGPRGEVVACASSPSAGDKDCGLGLGGRQGGARPPPEKFWIVVRGGLVAVGSGPHVAVGSIMASLSGEVPARPVKHIGFGLDAPKNAGKGGGASGLTVFRISVGGKLCPSVASASHLRLMTCRNEGIFARETESHRALVRTPPTRWAPPRGLKGWRCLASVTTWFQPRGIESIPGGGRLGDGAAGQGGGVRAAALLVGASVVASSPEWGWAVMPSVREEEEEEGSEAAVRDAAGLGGVGWERVGDTGKDILEESGLPVGRERRATSSAMAGRLIASALRPGKRARGGRGGVMRGDD